MLPPLLIVMLPRLAESDESRFSSSQPLHVIDLPLSLVTLSERNASSFSRRPGKSRRVPNYRRNLKYIIYIL